MCLNQCLIQVLGILRESLCPVMHYYKEQWHEWEEDIYKTIDSIAKRKIQEESGQLCLWSREKFTGPIPAHSIAWTCRATTLACSQHIPGCGIEQGCNFSFNRKIVKSRGLFSKLQKITQWKNYRHFPSEKSGWDQGLHALCQMMLCPLIASGEQAWARWTAWDVIINWPQWHSFTKCPSLCLVL